MSRISKEEALERLMYSCSRRELCLFDVRRKLMEWQLVESYDDIAELLLTDNFINEERYANSFVNDKIKYSKWGKLKVKYSLVRKGICEQIIYKALSDFPDEDYRQMIHVEIAKKNKTISETNQNKRKQKLIAFAKQRGYEPDTIYEIIND
jgi:regulatory protein